jgi:hypothetical protein
MFQALQNKEKSTSEGGQTWQTTWFLPTSIPKPKEARMATEIMTIVIFFFIPPNIQSYALIIPERNLKSHIVKEKSRIP